MTPAQRLRRRLAMVNRFNLYGRLGPRTLGIEPRLVRVELGEQDSSPSTRG